VTGSSGSVTLQVSDPGEYFIALFANDGYTEITDRTKVYVISIPVVEASKPGYSTGEQIVISYSNAPSLVNDWIGIYQVQHTPGMIGSTDWAYVYEESGTVTFSSLAGGYYFANYFLLNEYDEPGNREYFTVGDNLAVVSTNKASYTPGENIRVTLQNGPGLQNDFIKIFKEDDQFPTDSLAINGLPSGEFIYTGTLDTASYFLALFMNGTAHRISNRVPFAVSENAVSTGYDLLEESIRIYPSPTDGLLHIELHAPNENMLAIRATSLSGQQVLLDTFDETQDIKMTTMDLSGNTPGVYFISIITATSSSTRKVMLE
jgi:hypothetical protein